MDVLLTIGESVLLAGIVIGYGALKFRLMQAAEDRSDRKSRLRPLTLPGR